MRLDTRPPMPAAAREVPVDKPLSAQVCHALALVSGIIAVLCLFAALFGVIDPVGFYLALGSATNGVFWWVVGDLVCGVAQRSRRRD